METHNIGTVREVLEKLTGVSGLLNSMMYAVDGGLEFEKEELFNSIGILTISLSQGISDLEKLLKEASNEQKSI